MGIINYFMYNNKSSMDFGVWISGEATYQSPDRDMEEVAIPGRNGTLSLDNGRFQNLIIPYRAFITDDFERNFSAFKAFLMSVKGYGKLADTYHPEYFRLARFVSAIQPEMTQYNRRGQFTVNFDCDPRCFLKSGDRMRHIETGDTIRNSTLFTAKPFIRVYGTGAIAIGDCTVQVTSADVYTDIDAETQEAYQGNTNCNNNIVLVNGEFPTLAPGVTEITFTGFTEAYIMPRWWTI